MREKEGICVGCALGRERRKIFFFFKFFYIKKGRKQIGMYKLQCLLVLCRHCSSKSFGPLDAGQNLGLKLNYC